MNRFVSILICACITVAASITFADENTNIKKSALAVSSSGYPAAVAVAGPSHSGASAVAIAGVGVEGDTIVEKTSKESSEKTEDKAKAQKSVVKHVKGRGVAAMAVAGSGSAAAAVSPCSGSEVSYQTSSIGDGSAMVAVGSGSGGFIGVTSVAGKKPKVYTSRESMSADLDSDSNPALRLLQKLFDIFGW